MIERLEATLARYETIEAELAKPEVLSDIKKTTELSKEHQPETFEENKKIARRGGRIAGEARKSIEADTGKPVITSQNAAQLNQVVTDMIEGVVAEETGASDTDNG